MLLTTERLRIVPLTPRQLGLWLHDIPALGKELDCRCTAGSPRGDFRRIVEGQYALAAAPLKQADPATAPPSRKIRNQKVWKR